MAEPWRGGLYAPKKEIRENPRSKLLTYAHELGWTSRSFPSGPDEYFVEDELRDDGWEGRSIHLYHYKRSESFSAAKLFEKGHKHGGILTESETYLALAGTTCCCEIKENQFLEKIPEISEHCPFHKGLDSVNREGHTW